MFDPKNFGSDLGTIPNSSPTGHLWTTNFILASYNIKKTEIPEKFDPRGHHLNPWQLVQNPLLEESFKFQENVRS